MISIFEFYKLDYETNRNAFLILDLPPLYIWIPLFFISRKVPNGLKNVLIHLVLCLILIHLYMYVYIYKYNDGLVYKGYDYVSKDISIPKGYEKFSSYDYYTYKFHSFTNIELIKELNVSAEYTSAYLKCTLFTFVPHALFLYVLFFIQRRRIKKNSIPIS